MISSLGACPQNFLQPYPGPKIFQEYQFLRGRHIINLPGVPTFLRLIPTLSISYDINTCN